MFDWIYMYRMHTYAKCLWNVTIRDLIKVHYLRNVFSNIPKDHRWLDKFFFVITFSDITIIILIFLRYLVF